MLVSLTCCQPVVDKHYDAVFNWGGSSVTAVHVFATLELAQLTLGYLLDGFLKKKQGSAKRSLGMRRPIG